MIRNKPKSKLKKVEFMMKLEVIGNLGADAELKMGNGDKFVSFRVADSRKFIDKATGEVVASVNWVSCTMNGDGGNLMPYLKKGTKVFLRGIPTFKVFTSSKDGKAHAGVNLSVFELELCGGAKPQEEEDKPF